MIIDLSVCADESLNSAPFPCLRVRMHVYMFVRVRMFPLCLGASTVFIALLTSEGLINWSFVEATAGLPLISSSEEAEL